MWQRNLIVFRSAGGTILGRVPEELLLIDIPDWILQVKPETNCVFLPLRYICHSFGLSTTTESKEFTQRLFC